MSTPFPNFSPPTEEMVNPKRVKQKNSSHVKHSGPVVYFMERDHRLHDNWALRYAEESAKKEDRALLVLVVYHAPSLGTLGRHHQFFIDGLRDIESEAEKKGLSFHIIAGDPAEILPPYLKDIEASALIMDFNPLRSSRKKRDHIMKACDIPIFEVDAHNIVPVWETSQKREYGAYTIRPKIHRLLPHFLTQFPRKKLEVKAFKSKKIDWKSIESGLETMPEHPLYQRTFSGKHTALEHIRKDFLEERFSSYDSLRNDPTRTGQSNLSPYLHHGFIGAQRLALQVLTQPHRPSRNSFLEELIIRRELSDNFCFYDQAYDSFKSFPEWAQKTLEQHRGDTREYVYTLKEFREAETHDPLWNAAQRELLMTGKMHGYMRMYWAKKILEWTPTPEDALRIAITLNDTYALDGRDPNGYAGIAWSIGGVHDRAWFSRSVYGLVRYMSAGGAKTKFDTKGYIAKWGGEGKPSA